MIPLILSAFLMAQPGGDDSARREVQVLLETIETLHQPMQDFRCEYEGARRLRGKLAKDMNVEEDAISESYSGWFIWKKTGDVRFESLHRREPGGQVSRESTAVRIQQQQAEQYSRPNDASLGYSVIKKPKDVSTWHSSVGMIFLIEKIKSEVSDARFSSSVSDEEIDGRPFRVLSLSLKGVPDSLYYRYWIDLRRNGLVVRQENYLGKMGMVARLDIQLAAFKIGNAEVWMPVSGESITYLARVDNKPMRMKDPQSIESISVLKGTVEFNKHPGPDAFTIKYKAGTPISDSMRKLEYAFGQQKIATNPTKAEAERMLKEQLAKAEEQKSELVVASPSEGFDWAKWLTGGFGALIVISSALLWIQRRGN